MKTKVYFIGIVVFIFLLAVLDSPAMAVIRIMPLGDSITQGSASGVPNEVDQVSYRMTLWDMLDEAGYDVDFVGHLNSGSAVFGDADHEGHPGWTADEIRDKIYDWLVTKPADIILLHIGTNDFYEPQGPASISAEVSEILDEIDRYESDSGVDITVILALIINRWPYHSDTTAFNDEVDTMAQARINILGNRIEIVDMEYGADIVYQEQPAGDMYGELHPFETGYEKMADIWFSAILAITLPVADAGSNQNVSEFDSVTLDGSNSSDPDGSIVSGHRRRERL